MSSESLTFLSKSPEDSVSLKKLAEIPGFDHRIIKSTCFIPERNLFLVLPVQFNRISIYSTVRHFKLITTKTAQIKLNILNYSKELDKILLGGCYLQIWNPINFKLEAQSPEIPKDHGLMKTLVYLPSPKVIVAKTTSAIYIFDQYLALEARFELLLYGGTQSSTADFFSVSQRLLLAVCHYSFEQPRLFLLNLKNEAVKELDQLNIPYIPCVEMTQEAPSKVFTCLISLTKYDSARRYEQNPSKLTQFTIDPQKEELVISRVTKTDHSFNSLFRLKNSNYFLAEGWSPSNISELFLLLINKDQVQITQVISREEIYIGRLNTFTMGKSLLFQIEGGVLYLYSCTNQRKKNSKSQESSLQDKVYGL